MKHSCFMIWVLVIYLNLFIHAQPFVTSLDSFGIEVSPRNARQVIFSNHNNAYWVGEINQQNNQSDRGYFIHHHRYLIDYAIYRDGKMLDRAAARRIQLFPDRLRRDYPGMEETLFFPDSICALLLSLKSTPPGVIHIAVQLDDWLRDVSWQWDAPQHRATTTLLDAGGMQTAAIGVQLRGNFSDASLLDSTTAARQVGMTLRKNTLLFRVEDMDSVFLLIAFTDRPAGVSEFLKKNRQHPLAYVEKRRHRYREVLKSCRLNTGKEPIDRAYARALFSLDDLILPGKDGGIWSGLPTKDVFRGRDTFISYTGALLCTGKFETARNILLAVANLQNTDINSPDYGKIPNTLVDGNPDYHEADVTPWFVRACEQYVRYSGDTEFISRIFPTLKKAMDGAIKYHLDEYGFLTHADDATWMDRVGSHGSVTPRGNKAVEIQALWIEQVRISREWAEFLGYPNWADDWKLLEERLRLNFTQIFWNPDPPGLYDFIAPGNRAHLRVRPNCLLAAALANPPVLSNRQIERMLAAVQPQLIYPWGVATLSQEDSHFHPYHFYSDYYLPDASLHNGLVWKWLNGPVTSLMVHYQPGAALTLLRNSVGEILGGEVPGTLPQLVDAWEKQPSGHEGIQQRRAGFWEQPVALSGAEEAMPATPEASGALSSAPALAEFIRNWHEDVMGIQPKLKDNIIRLAPRLIDVFPSVSFKTRLGNALLSGKYFSSPEKFSLEMQSDPHLPDLTLSLSIPFNGKWIAFDVPWKGGEKLHIEIRPFRKKNLVTVNGKVWEKVRESLVREQQPVPLAKPAYDFSLQTFRKPLYGIISGTDALRKHGRLTPLLFDIKDSKGDDHGPAGGYTYPLSSVFQPGIFDLRRVRIRKDDQYLYLEIDYQNLVNPDGNALPGYQYTFTAITLSFEKLVRIRSNRLESNANFSVPYEYAFNYVIYVGNGYRITDARGKIIAEYHPAAGDRPMGSVKKKKIRFSVPLKYLSERFLRNAVVLTGGWQETTPGAVGEFRDVYKEADPWHGGGGEKERGNPNIYDILFIRR